MVAQLERIITIAEAVNRAQAAIRKVRQGGNGEAAASLERECSAQCKKIVSVARGRRRNASRARKQLRNGNGRFT